MKKQLIHVTLIARADDGIWYICAELFAKDLYNIKLISSTVMPLLHVYDLVKKLYSVEANPYIHLN
jgi:hypothetical protein